MAVTAPTPKEIAENQRLIDAQKRAQAIAAVKAQTPSFLEWIGFASKPAAPKVPPYQGPPPMAQIVAEQKAARSSAATTPPQSTGATVIGGEEAARRHKAYANILENGGDYSYTSGGGMGPHPTMEVTPAIPTATRTLGITPHIFKRVDPQAPAPITSTEAFGISPCAFGACEDQRNIGGMQDGQGGYTFATNGHTSMLAPPMIQNQGDLAWLDLFMNNRATTPDSVATAQAGLDKQRVMNFQNSPEFTAVVDANMKTGMTPSQAFALATKDFMEANPQFAASYARTGQAGAYDQVRTDALNRARAAATITNNPGVYNTALQLFGVDTPGGISGVGQAPDGSLTVDTSAGMEGDVRHTFDGKSFSDVSSVLNDASAGNNALFKRQDAQRAAAMAMLEIKAASGDQESKMLLEQMKNNHIRGQIAARTAGELEQIRLRNQLAQQTAATKAGGLTGASTPQGINDF